MISHYLALWVLGFLYLRGFCGFGKRCRRSVRAWKNLFCMHVLFCKVWETTYAFDASNPPDQRRRETAEEQGGFTMSFVVSRLLILLQKWLKKASKQETNYFHNFCSSSLGSLAILSPPRLLLIALGGFKGLEVMLKLYYTFVSLQKGGDIQWN